MWVYLEFVNNNNVNINILYTCDLHAQKIYYSNCTYRISTSVVCNLVS